MRNVCKKAEVFQFKARAYFYFKNVILIHMMRSIRTMLLIYALSWKLKKVLKIHLAYHENKTVLKSSQDAAYVGLSILQFCFSLNGNSSPETIWTLMKWLGSVISKYLFHLTCKSVDKVIYDLSSLYSTPFLLMTSVTLCWNNIRRTWKFVNLFLHFAYFKTIKKLS